ncbi:hypothetical protein EV2_014576 [Malus domestica]
MTSESQISEHANTIIRTHSIKPRDLDIPWAMPTSQQLIGNRNPTNGLRSRTRDLFSRAFRKKGYIPLSIYLKTYRTGDNVDVKVNGADHKGMPPQVLPRPYRSRLERYQARHRCRDQQADVVCLQSDTLLLLRNRQPCVRLKYPVHTNAASSWFPNTPAPATPLAHFSTSICLAVMTSPR